MERPADHYEQDLLNIVEIVVMVKCRGQMLEDDHQIDWEESVVKRTSTKKSQRSILNSISTRICMGLNIIHAGLEQLHQQSLTISCI